MPQISSLGSSLGFFSQAMHLVLDVMGLGLVENFKPWLVLKSWAILSMFFKRDAGGQEDVVLRVAVGASIDPDYSAAAATLLKEVKELKTIETVCIAGQNLALANSVTNDETGRYL